MENTGSYYNFDSFIGCFFKCFSPDGILLLHRKDKKCLGVNKLVRHNTMERLRNRECCGVAVF